MSRETDSRLTTMNQAMARPRVTGSWKTSASIPVVTAIGALAKVPTKNRKTSIAGQFGARAQAIVKIVNIIKHPTERLRRPTCSLIGPP